MLIWRVPLSLLEFRVIRPNLLSVVKPLMVGVLFRLEQLNGNASVRDHSYRRKEGPECLLFVR